MSDRGWTDADLESIKHKIEHAALIDPEPFIVTEAEMRAHIAWMRERGKTSWFEAPK